MSANRQLQLELAILSGDQQGARAPLKSGETIDISNSVDSYIVINDQNITDEKISLKINERSASLKMIAGSATIMGKKLSAGQSKTLKMYQRVELGKTCFAYGEVGSMQWQEGIDRFEPGKNLRLTASHLLSAMDFPVIAKWTLVLLVLVAGALLSLQIVKEMGNYQNNGHAERDLAIIKQSIDDFGLEDMNLVSQKNGQISLEGYINNRKQYLEFNDMIDQVGDKVSVDIKKNIILGDAIARKVKDIYRLNGLAVDATIKEKGVVQIVSPDSNLEKLKKIRAMALNDVTHLTDILITTGGGAVTFDQPDKRILMVVKGATSYVVTADGAKYSVGSVLASGQKITEIHNNKLVLLENGKKVNFSL